MDFTKTLRQKNSLLILYQLKEETFLVKVIKIWCKIWVNKLKYALIGIILNRNRVRKCWRNIVVTLMIFVCKQFSMTLYSKHCRVKLIRFNKKLKKKNFKIWISNAAKIDKWYIRHLQNLFSFPFLLQKIIKMWGFQVLI